MKYNFLGRSGLKVSQLCLGTMNFGWQTTEKEALKIMDAARDAGINLFDTADCYTDYESLVGEPCVRRSVEKMIGRWFAQGDGRRESTILASKFSAKLKDGHEGPNNEPGLSAYKMRIRIEESLKCLQTDRVELYQMHHVDRNCPWDELWGAFDSLLTQGKIYYVGSSNFAGIHLMKAQWEASKKNLQGLVSEQHRYNLVSREPELEVIPAAKDLGIGLMIWSPLNGGLLSGHALSDERKHWRYGRDEADIQKHRQQLLEYSELCKELGESQANVALAWLLANPAVTAPIIGPRTLEQLESVLRAVEIQLEESVLKRLDEIFPGPGGEAPEAYAW